MLVTKIFHVHQTLASASRRLREPETWHDLAGATEIHCSMQDGIGHLEFSPRMGQRVSAAIQEMPGDNPSQIIFRSVGGDIELAGMVELFEIRENLTEAVLTLDYEPASPWQKAFEAVDRFLNRQLGRLETCMERASEAKTDASLTGRYA